MIQWILNFMSYDMIFNYMTNDMTYDTLNDIECCLVIIDFFLTVFFQSLKKSKKNG